MYCLSAASARQTGGMESPSDVGGEDIKRAARTLNGYRDMLLTVASLWCSMMPRYKERARLDGGGGGD